jgi:hypothetical protein
MEITYIVGLVQCWVGIRKTLGYHSGIPIWTSQGITFSDALTENPDHQFSLVCELDAPKEIQMLKPGWNKTSDLGGVLKFMYLSNTVKIRFRLTLGRGRRFPMGSLLFPKPYILLVNRKGLEPLSSSSYTLLFDM